MKNSNANPHAVDVLCDGLEDRIEKVLSGKLTRWELPLHLRHRVDQLTRIVNAGLYCGVDVSSPEPVRLLDTSDSDTPEKWWYEWAFSLDDDRTSDGSGFFIDIRDDSPELLSHHLRIYAQELLDMADKIEAMDW